MATETKMKSASITVILIFLCFCSVGQKTLLVEKIGSSRKFYYHLENQIKLKTTDNRMVLGRITMIADSSITVSSERYAIPVKSIASVYQQFGFPHRFGKRLCIAGGVFLAIVTVNNLMNNQQVFPAYGFIIGGACLAGGLISLSLSQQKFKMGYRWKLKVLDFTVP